MLRFSANLGFLWLDRPLPERIAAAAAAGFDAVECHFPFDVPEEEVGAALGEAGLEMVSLNTRPGDAAKGEFGLCALPGREAEARYAIDEATVYARGIGAGAVHVMAGKPPPGSRGRARRSFLDALDYAAAQAHDLTILIEPLNDRDAPGYFIKTAEEAAVIIDELGHSNIKILFDCYHQQIMGGDLTCRLKRLLPGVGHVQIAAVPSRGEPDLGEVAYDRLLCELDGLGYEGFIGAEYRPRGRVEDGLGWLARFRGER